MFDDAFTGSARFELRRRLGEGGMGVVYEAFDRERAAPVALKTLRTPGPELLLRLKHEFRALQDVRHPNLVGMGELFEAGGQWFFTMDLVDGAPFWDHVRPSAAVIGDADTIKIAGATARGLAALDEARLRDALIQLALGLQHLHQVGMVHRDVKPSNILVDRDGRVVLLDFGLVASADERRGTGDVVGTVAYMAPEQAAGAAVGGAADWYAMGVLLYEALTGQLPFDGAPLQILLDKQRLAPAPPHAIAPGVPADLDELALELLRFDPAARPSGATILARLGAASAPEAARTSGASSGFVGREAELAMLDAAAADVAPDHPVMVYVHGGSGVGKSALVARFTATQGLEPAVVVLHGRCYEREAVPYKAVDGVVDALADYLQRLPRGEAAGLLPRRAALLVDVFPVLGKVEVLAEAPRGPDLRDPQELRARLFDAARELFARLCDRRRVVVAIDDLQWADPDSLALLAALLRAPDAPPLLLVATVRGPEDDPAAPAARLALPGDLRHLVLAPLAPADARALTARLVGGGEGAAGAALVDAIAREAGGHPLFIHELARHAAVHGAAAIGVVRLDDALSARIARLEPSTRRLLEIVALAGAPIEQEAAGRAAGLEPSALARHAQVLRVEHLARTSGPRGVDAIEPFHDRIRDAVLAHVDAALAPTLHLRLARALEATSRADPAALARHLRAAGEPERAAHYAGLGAEQATRALAFDRAADLYRLALALWPAQDPRAAAHRIALADVLMFGGRGAAAAAEYRAAARHASPELAIDLHRRAAQQLLLAGHLDDGLAALRDVLAAHDLPFPETAARAGLAIAGDRLRLRLRGLGFAARPERELPARTLARVDVCYHASAALGSVDVMRGSAFAVRGLRLALAAGEPYRVARALAIYAAMRAVEGGPAARTVAGLLARCAPISQAAAHPHAHAILVGARGQAAFLAGRYREAFEACTEAEALFRDHCPGATREVNTVRLWCARSLMQLGELQELARRTPALLRECRDRGDRYGDVSLRAAAYPLVLLCADDPSQARAEVAAAEAGWTSVGYHVQHYYALATRVAIALYVGDATHARAIARANARQVRRSLLSRIQVVRLASLELVGRAALAVAVRQPDPDVLRDVDRAAARIARERMGWADPLAAALRAGAAVVRGRPDLAAARLAEAIAGFERADMALHAHVARWRRAALVGGVDGERAIEAAAGAMRAEGVHQPARLAALYLPWPDGRTRARRGT